MHTGQKNDSPPGFFVHGPPNRAGGAIGPSAPGLTASSVCGPKTTFFESRQQRAPVWFHRFRSTVPLMMISVTPQRHSARLQARKCTSAPVPEPPAHLINEGAIKVLRFVPGRDERRRGQSQAPEVNDGCNRSLSSPSSMRRDGRQSLSTYIRSQLAAQKGAAPERGWRSSILAPASRPFQSLVVRSAQRRCILQDEFRRTKHLKSACFSALGKPWRSNARVASTNIA